MVGGLRLNHWPKEIKKEKDEGEETREVEAIFSYIFLKANITI